MSDLYLFPADIRDYFDGVLKNVGDTEYFAYSYDSHYYLVYNLQLEDGSAVPGDYPVVELFPDTDAVGYTVVYSTTAVSSVPAAAYGSFGLYSDLRSGTDHTVFYAILFAICFSIGYKIFHHIFSNVE